MQSRSRTNAVFLRFDQIDLPSTSCHRTSLHREGLTVTRGFVAVTTTQQKEAENGSVRTVLVSGCVLVVPRPMQSCCCYSEEGRDHVV